MPTSTFSLFHCPRWYTLILQSNDGGSIVVTASSVRCRWSDLQKWDVEVHSHMSRIKSLHYHIVSIRMAHSIVARTVEWLYQRLNLPLLFMMRNFNHGLAESWKCYGHLKLKPCHFATNWRIALRQGKWNANKSTVHTCKTIGNTGSCSIAWEKQIDLWPGLFTSNVWSRSSHFFWWPEQRRSRIHW